MKQFTLGLLCAPIAALVLALALNISPRTDMGGSGGFNIVFGALWAFVFVWGIGLRVLPIRDSLLSGAAYGFLGWIIGPVTIGGVLSGHGAMWSVPEFAELFPDLIAYVLYGIALGLLYPLLYQVYVTRQPLAFGREVRYAALRGGLAGLVVGLIFINRLPFLGLLPVPGMHPESTPRLFYLFLSVVVGGVLGLVIEQAHERSGVSLIRGMAHGILWWELFVLTLQPLISGERVYWALSSAQAHISELLGLIVFGSALALAYHLLTLLIRTLFTDNVGLDGQEEGIGIRNLRVIGWGIVGSLFGGLAFTVVMVQTGALPMIAGIVRGGDATTGLVVHFIISFIIGAMYGLLFSGQADSYGSAIGWGTAYGLLWWVLGPILLLPLLLGRDGTLTTGAALAAYPASFIGHVAYGVITAVYFYTVERRRAVERGNNMPEQVGHRPLAQSPLWLLLALFVAIVPILLHS